jgi:hypothetical protein
MRYIFGFLLCLIGQGVVAQECQPTQPILVKECKPCPSWWDKGWAMTVYSGPVTAQTTSKLFGDFDFDGAGIVVLAGSKELFYVWDNRLNFELEAQVGQHFGKQKHAEINPIVFIARWRDFPWNESLCTTFAIGDGLSIATETPRLERKRRKKHGKALNYVMAELTLSLPEIPQWAFVARYHHRSGMFGVFHGVHDASTAFAAGLKYWF